MKLYLFAGVVMLLIYVIFVPTSLADSGLTVVRGNIYYQGSGGTIENAELKGIAVDVSCVIKEKKNGELKIRTKSTVTNSFGLYTVNFREERCEAFHNVKAAVTFKGKTQNNSVWVSDIHTATMDFYFDAAPVSVPEFGLLPGVVAAITSAGAFFGLKLKKRV